MIKLMLGDRNSDGKNKLLLLGVTREALERLQGGEPIMVGLHSFGMPHLRIGLCYGETTVDIANDIRAHMGVEIPEFTEPGPGETVVVETNRPPGG
jgi:hypothetical protein